MSSVVVGFNKNVVDQNRGAYNKTLNLLWTKTETKILKGGKKEKSATSSSSFHALLLPPFFPTTGGGGIARISQVTT